MWEAQATPDTPQSPSLPNMGKGVEAGSLGDNLPNLWGSWPPKKFKDTPNQRIAQPHQSARKADPHKASCTFEQ